MTKLIWIGSLIFVVLMTGCSSCPPCRQKPDPECHPMRLKAKLDQATREGRASCGK